MDVAVKLMLLSMAAADALSATTISHEYEPAEPYVPVLVSVVAAESLSVER